MATRMWSKCAGTTAGVGGAFVEANDRVATATLPAPSHARTVSVWKPLASNRVSRSAANGPTVACLTRPPSAKNSTRAMPLASVAEAVTRTTPERVALLAMSSVSFGAATS